MGVSDTDSTAGRCVHTDVHISSEEQGPGLTTETFVQRSELRETGQWRDATESDTPGTRDDYCTGSVPAFLTATGFVTIQTYSMLLIASYSQ